MKKAVAVVLLLLLPSGVLSQGFGIGARAGLVKPEDIDMTMAFGAMGTYRVVPAVELEASVDYWTKSWTESFFGYEMDAKVSDLGVSGYAKYVVHLPSSPVFFGLGAGLGAHFLSAEVTTEDPWLGEVSASDTETRFGVHFFGEVGVPVAPVVLLSARARFGMVEDYNRTDLTAGLIFGKHGTSADRSAKD